MFMRLLQVHVKSSTISHLPTLYNETIAPELRRTPGCLYGGLIQNVHQPEECISMTLWETPEHAESYEQGGMFQKLLNQAESHFSESLEWRIQLSKDLTLDYSPIQDEPVVKSYKVVTGSAPMKALGQNSDRLYIRILSIKLRPGKLEEFARLYNEQIIPALRYVHGCQYAFLTEGIEERNEVLSVTIWDRKENADAYEALGTFDIVICRNVFSYFSQREREKLAENLYNIMEPGGTMLISTKETLYNVTKAFKLQTYEKVVVYKKA